MKFDPKPHQIQAINELAGAISKKGGGYRRVCLQAPTGVGKTFIAAMIIDGALRKGNRVTFVAPYSVLINQTVDRFVEQGLPLPGVMQGQHELTDATRPIQIATAQTLGRRQRPICDVVIVDETHLQYKSIVRWMEDEPEKIFIGLTATPFARGMGKNYQKLIKIKSLRECIQDGTLSSYEVYGIESPDLSSVGVSNGDYKQGELGDVMAGAILVGNIVSNWLENGESRQTICFAVNVLHANKVANDFDSAGIRAEVIIAETPLDERQEMFKRFERRETQILVSVGCLIAGFDSYVDCIIWASPTKSSIKFLQGNGRGLRRSKGKDYCLIFDHSGSFTTMGYLEDVDEGFDGLCSGEKKEVERQKVEREKKKKNPKECPKCKYIKPPGIHECPKCGFAPRYGEDVEVDETRGLKKLKGEKKTFTKQEKEQFWRELMGVKMIHKSETREKSPGFYAHTYKAKFGVWPKGLSDAPLNPSPGVRNYVQSKLIAYAKGQKKKAASK